MPSLDQIAYYSEASTAVNQWTRPFSMKVKGVPGDAGEYRLSLNDDTLDTWAEYKTANQIMLSLYDSQGDDIEIPSTGNYALVLHWPRKAQALRYRVQSTETKRSSRQPHIVFDVALLEATGADTTADDDEPVEVTLETFTQTETRGFWVKLLPISVSGSALMMSETGEIDVTLKQKFLARFSSRLTPGFQFLFENDAYVVVAVSRKDRRRNVILYCNRIGGETG